MTRKRFGARWAAVAMALAGAAGAWAQGPPPYQDLYAQLDGDIGDLDQAILSTWDGSRYPVAFAGQLTAANANDGPGLLQPASLALIQSEILALQAIGARAIAVEVSFPMLDADFFTAIGHPEYQTQFTTFYSSVAAAIRAQGLRVIVESQSMIPTGLESTWGPGLQSYYASFTTFSAYESARARTAAVVAKTLQPDFFVLQEEPDTEAAQSKQSSAGTVAGSTDMLNGSLAAVRAANVAGMKVGAGFGTWLQAYPLFANSFARQHCGQQVQGQTQPCLAQPLDFLDLHLYPINEHTSACSPPPASRPCASPDFGRNALAIVATANAGHLPLTLSQTWLRKVRDDEWVQIDGDIQEAREAYSFWTPLDSAFLQTVYHLANYAHLLFAAPFNTQSDTAYLTWTGGSSTCTVNSSPPCTAIRGEGGGNSPADVFSSVQATALANLAAARYTSVAMAWHDLIATDVAAPSSPANVTVSRDSSSTAKVSWSASTDDVGVAGYHLWRDGSALPDVLAPPWEDHGLAPAAQPTYEVQAFDLAGRTSARVSSSGSPPTGCSADAQTACLQAGGRFEVTVEWSNDQGSGRGQVMSFGGQRAETNESVFFWFQDAASFEMGVKVLDACMPSLGEKFWVYVSGLTDQGWQVTVRDTVTGATRTYSNPNHHLSTTFADTAAFDCP